MREGKTKILQLALFSSRLDDPANFKDMLEEEKLLYDNLVSVLNRFRNDILSNVLLLKDPNMGEESQPKELKMENKPINKLIRFLHATPKFLGDDLKVYGPFEEEDVAALPPKIADILINNSRAEEMNKA